MTIGTKKVRVVIVDDFEVVREGLRLCLNRERDFVVVGEAASGREAIRLVPKVKPDLVVLDAKLGDIPGPEVCRKLREQSPSTQVIILTAFDDADLVGQSMSAGAAAYMLKDINTDVLKRRIRDVLNSDLTYDWARSRPSAHQSPDVTLKDFLSATDLAIIRHVSEGLTNKEVAQQLALSPDTIKDRIGKICRVFRVRTRSHLVAQAMRQKII
jgi:two-component system NarL family response regulator